MTTGATFLPEDDAEDMDEEANIDELLASSSSEESAGEDADISGNEQEQPGEVYFSDATTDPWRTPPHLHLLDTTEEDGDMEVDHQPLLDTAFDTDTTHLSSDTEQDQDSGRSK